jgi:mannose-6-phosphate isomerase-like protein (cupin superfamily)
MSFIKKLIIGFLSILPISFANAQVTDPMVAQDIFSQADQNDNWKLAFATGKQAQIVFMNVSPSTNPNNEIGMETHAFDQVIFITQGNGQAVLNGKTSVIQKGDMIFIPLGTAHNVINLNKDQPLKIISVYSETDIPAGSVIPKKQ